VWSPDNSRLAFQSDRGGDTAIWAQAANGSGDAARLTKADDGTVHVPESWSRDYLSYSVVAASGAELWLRSMSDGTTSRFGDVRSNAPFNSALSPDGKWIAYTERGRAGNIHTAVFVQPVPATGAPYQISPVNDLGHHPFWSYDGKELFYWASDGMHLVSTVMDLTGSVTIGNPVRVSGSHRSNTTSLGPLNYDMTPDGSEFVLTRTVSDDTVSAGVPVERSSIKVVLNWFEELKRLGTVKP
jgi:Tol biopolymer transport system component